MMVVLLNSACGRLGSSSSPDASSTPLRSLNEGTSCTLDGRTIADGASVPAFFKDHASLYDTCASEVRACDHGHLSGSAPYAECKDLCAVVPTDNVLFRQPQLDDARACLAVSPTSPTPAGKFAVALNMGPGQTPVVDLWSLGDFTGFYPSDPGTAQVGVSNAWYGSHGVQVEGRTVGSQIHPESLMPLAAGMTLFNVIESFNFAAPTRPFARPDTILSYALDVQIPRASSDGIHTFAYANLYVSFKDRRSQLWFWYGADLFDNNARSFTDLVMYDGNHNGATNVPIVTGALGQASEVLTDLGGSAFQPATWTGYRPFRFGIGAEDLRRAVRSIKKQIATQPNMAAYAALSEDPSDYELTSFNFNPEVADLDGKGFGWMAAAARDITISTLNGGTFCSAWNTKITWVCGTRPDAGDWSDVGHGCYQLDSTHACE